MCTLSVHLRPEQVTGDPSPPPDRLLPAKTLCAIVSPPPLVVISFIPYIEDSVLGLISQDSGLFLKNGGRPFVRQRLSDPSSLTELHLSISDLFLGEQSV